MANISEKRSAFDILMSKKKEQNQRKQDNELNNSKHNDSFSDIILIENKSITNYDIIELKESDLTLKRKSLEPIGSNKKLISSSTSSSPNENLTKRSPLEYDRKPTTSKTESERDFFLHLQQHSDKDKNFLRERFDSSKFKLKPEESKLNLNINLNASLNFDLTHLTEKFQACKCQSKESNFEHFFKDVTFSLNNSTENIKLDEDLKHVENISIQDDSLNKSDLNKCTPEKERYSKRRKTEKKTAEKKLSPVVEFKNVENKKSSKILENQELWTEKYQFKTEDDIVTNNSQFERLKEWLNNWKSILSKDQANQSKSKNSSPYDSSDSEYAYDSECSYASDSSTSGYKKKFYSNAILLSGPHGCGKTSSIYSVAKQLGFKVFEINSSGLRCKSQIIQELEGALNSHHVSSKANNDSNSFSSNDINKKEIAKQISNDKLKNFFNIKPSTSSQTLTRSPKKVMESSQIAIETKTRKKRKISLRKETVLAVHHNSTNPTKSTLIELDSSTSDSFDSTDSNLNRSFSDNNNSGNVKIHTESLILFDEIDVVFKEDVGFLSAINHFIKKSRKPIVLTTNDDYLQEKINLNIEKIDFIRPRIESSIKFLRKVATLENKELDKPTANKIIQECKFDIRRALMQLQALIYSSENNQKLNRISLSNTFDFNKHLSTHTFSKCEFHNETSFFSNIFFLDILTKNIIRFSGSSITDISNGFKKYDMFILRDGLTDNDAINSYNTATFNPFMPMVVQKTDFLDDSDYNIDNFNKSNSILITENFHDFFQAYMTGFNMNRFVNFNDWCKHGSINQFNYSSNAAMNRFAMHTYKLTSNSSLSLDYRPYLHKICQFEETKQTTSTSRRRYIHYLSHLNIGLIKDDYNLLARSILDEKDSEITDFKTTIIEDKMSNKLNAFKFDSSIYSNDNDS